jgi:molybdenum cofactor synthesis domain-containing protein
MAEDRIYTAALLIIGNEILSGRTQDSNLAYIGKGLNDVGVRLMEVRVVADIEAAIVKAVRELSAENDYVFTTGGIGPTHDDITCASIAAAFNVKVIRHPVADALLRDYYGDRVNAARMKMADVPEGSDLIDNPVSKAPGFRIGNVHCMAGVPRIMQAQFDGVRHSLKGGKPMLSRSVTVFLAESQMAADLTKLQEKYASTEMGSYPFSRNGTFGTAIVTRCTDAATLDAAVIELKDMMIRHGGTPQDDA